MRDRAWHTPGITMSTASGHRPFPSSFREIFGEKIEVYFVFNGTGAKVLAVAASNRPCEAVVFFAVDGLADSIKNASAGGAHHV